jgi:hypothetical protein
MNDNKTTYKLQVQFLPTEDWETLWEVDGNMVTITELNNTIKRYRDLNTHNKYRLVKIEVLN